MPNSTRDCDCTHHHQRHHIPRCNPVKKCKSVKVYCYAESTCNCKCLHVKKHVLVNKCHRRHHDSSDSCNA